MRQFRTSASHRAARVDGPVRDRAPLLMRVSPPRGEPRTEQQLREHYLVERELADRLRNAPRSERRVLYSQLYDELIRRVRHLPIEWQEAGHALRQSNIAHQIRFLRRFLSPDTVFMEIGAGDCALAMHVASLVKQVYAIDVSEQITRGVAPLANFKLLLSDGCSTPVPEGSIDVAYSNQLMEHLHPDDASEQLRNISRSLAPGGIYVCITPNRMYGPCDISKYFDEIATGFHLREYTAREMRQLLIGAGFADVRFYARARGRFLRSPYGVIAVLESALGAMPYALRNRIADTRPMRALLELRVAASKPYAGAATGRQTSRSLRGSA